MQKYDSQNMHNDPQRGWHDAETAPLREAHRATSKDVCATLYTPVQKQHRSAENARARTTSVSMSYACRQSSVVLKQGENKFFREVTGGLGRGIWTGFCAYDAILWFLHKFNVDLKYLVEALREFKAVARLMCTAPFSQPNTSVHPFTDHNSCGHYPFLMRKSSWRACARSCQPTLLVRKVFYSKLTAWQIWPPRKSSRVETE